MRVLVVVGGGWRGEERGRRRGIKQCTLGEPIRVFWVILAFIQTPTLNDENSRERKRVELCAVEKKRNWGGGLGGWVGGWVGREVVVVVGVYPAMNTRASIGMPTACQRTSEKSKLNR